QDLDDPRLRLSTTVQTIDWSAAESGGDIVVHTDCGSFSAPHVVSTFSVGVLQHQDVHFTPRLPDWKKEAIFTFGMATYQKIFFLFDQQFWGDEQVRRAF
ncbi:FAD-dependent oxidoreductase, partial [Enterobacter hormaechei]|nr:FAD-dependent oxidoreductase [Enterobacter hormaechei]